MMYQIMFKRDDGMLRIIVCWVLSETDDVYLVTTASDEVEPGEWGVMKQNVFQLRKSEVLKKLPLVLMDESETGFLFELSPDSEAEEDESTCDETRTLH